MNAHLPAFEALEPRSLLSGNVAASISGGNLTLTGDALDNAVTLTRNGDSVTVTPDAGTTVNRGLAGAPVELLHVTGKITIRMNNGNDVVVITGQVVDGVTEPFAVGAGLKDLNIDMGKGDDQVTLAAVQARHVTIVTGVGVNSVTLTGLDPDAEAGGPADAQTLVNGNLTITGSSGDETVWLRGAAVAGNATLKLGTGGNAAHLGAFDGSDADFDLSIARNFTFDCSLARKACSLAFEDANGAGAVDIGGQVRILLGLMDDTLTAVPEAALSVGGSLFVNGCYGNDTISLSGADVGQLLIVNSGYGDDAVTLESNTVGWAQWVDGALTIPRFPGFVLPSFLSATINRFATGHGSCPDLSRWGF